MKRSLSFSLQAVVEHEKTGSVIANSLLDIADALPGVKLVSILYPTEPLQRMVATLYVPNEVPPSFTMKVTSKEQSTL